MENAIADEDYVKAVKSAIELHRPHKLYKLFELLVRLASLFFVRFSSSLYSYPSTLMFCSKGILDDTTKITFKTLEKGEILVLLEYIREWNTKIKFCEVALRIFLRIMTMYPPKKILEVKHHFVDLSISILSILIIFEVNSQVVTCDVLLVITMTISYLLIQKTSDFRC